MQVEIDESMFVRRKGNVGRTVNEQWVFGGICRETRECFLVAVPDRRKETLQSVIKDFVRPKTIIVSDCWAAYQGIEEIPERDYLHVTVNHSSNFVDPTTGACTNLVEGMWGRAKSKFRKKWGTHRAMLDSYLCEFMWRARLDGKDPFSMIMNDIAKLDPPQ